MASGFELYIQRDDGSRETPIARGPMSLIVAHVRALKLQTVKDPHHPLGVYYVSERREVYVVDFFLDFIRDV